MNEPHSLRVAVLTRSWARPSETDWVSRQFGGALATSADVHVVTTQGTEGVERTDGVFTVHELGLDTDPRRLLRRELVVTSLAESLGGDWARQVAASPELRRLVDRDAEGIWCRAIPILRQLKPDMVVVAGYHESGAPAAIDSACPDVPVVLLPLADERASAELVLYEDLLGRAADIVTFTHEEQRLFVDRNAHVTCLGFPLAVNESVLREPNTFLGEDDYLVVISGSARHSAVREASAAGLLCTSFPSTKVALCTPEALVIWHKGTQTRTWPVRRGTDLLRLMAWATALVDVRPGRLFARQSLESLLYSTAIVVPGASRAREHAEVGKGGLWFTNPGELVWAADAMLGGAAATTLGEQGNQFARTRCSPDRFLDEAVGVMRHAIGSERVRGATTT